MRITLPSFSEARTYPRSRSVQMRGRALMILFLLGLTYLAWPSPPLPPTYADEWKRERQLPQHNPWLPAPEGRDGRYVRFDVPPTDLHGQLQHALLQHHVAVSSNRSFAFSPIRNAGTLEAWAWPWRNTRIPLGAVTRTATSGFEKLADLPRAVSASYYGSVCRRERVYTVRSPQFPNGDLDLQTGGRARLEQLASLLAGEDGCIRIRGDVFPAYFMDDGAAMDMIHDLVNSPVLQHFSFGAPVLDALNRALPVLAPSSEPYNLEAKGIKLPPWKHLLALQAHSSAWEDKCRDLGNRSALFVGFNKLPSLPGNENIPPHSDMLAPARAGLYAAKCAPQTTAVIARARRMRKNHPILRAIYLVTDSDEWADELARWLLSDGWEAVYVASEVHNAWRDWEVRPMVDTEVMRRAGVFVGNGFTTMASNVALLRARDLVHPDFTQFW
ncbi:hypothetical protein CcaverHIS002_0403850 [Cutaneotrichosporon cavernicola]|uniref:Uncharacterized protein n=1 Tax=Cutaneotrichosporon cavernicola TaxID=279322 RepID=A0AA48QVP6_9TREE|nr:uncharacterized protein CcaverHIS019_0403800 [Cutaneotrichosporon cavernicola]BEI83781.1 hypothetical protein CcaverHIS002_0403850 [Cutaneotrichosporon cavernicola]BEI91560.1 hypothetical protein CcaverHIS019_0403800 [Cutaneotrichosporon cavernicola]BEI99337.1 hypothetical protein CcaverHIS631_0403800 [Cutaneotrichosporon cavernicola]BEJ07112.1 hypothetical protein CcaverHIS641_0403810 [Cutaneotrichosporon cavernicola]